MHNYKKLMVWQDAVDFSVKLYHATKTFPADERFGLISQLRRASVSIPSNIAEGAGRNSRKSFAGFLDVSLGSSFELETQLLISKKVGYLTEVVFDELMRELSRIQKMIVSFRKRLITGGSNLSEE